MTTTTNTGPRLPIIMDNQKRPSLHVRTVEQPDGTWSAEACRGQRPVQGTWRLVTVHGLQTERAAESAAVRCWWDTAERVGWL